MLIEGCYNLIKKCLNTTLRSVSPLVYGFGSFFYRKLLKTFSQINISVIFTHEFKIKSLTHIFRQIFKGMLILISSLKLSTVSYAAGPESRGHSRTAWLYNNVKLLPKFHCSLDS